MCWWSETTSLNGLGPTLIRLKGRNSCYSTGEQLHHLVWSAQRNPYCQGRDFESNLVQEMCQLIEINKTRTTPWHPQSDRDDSIGPWEPC